MVSAEILMASEPGCPIEMHKIPITSGDEMYDQEQRGDRFMPFHRARSVRINKDSQIIVGTCENSGRYKFLAFLLL